MATETLITPTTAAVESPNHVAFNTNGYDRIVLLADGLAGDEEVDIFVGGGAAYAVFGDGSAALKLTATLPALELPAGPTYAVLKDATAGACGVYVVRGSGGSVG